MSIIHVWAVGKYMIGIIESHDEPLIIDDDDIKYLLELKSEFIEGGKISPDTKIKVVPEH